MFSLLWCANLPGKYKTSISKEVYVPDYDIGPVSIKRDPTKSEIRLIAERDPAQIDRIEALE